MASYRLYIADGYAHPGPQGNLLLEVSSESALSAALVGLGKQTNRQVQLWRGCQTSPMVPAPWQSAPKVWLSQLVDWAKFPYGTGPDGYPTLLSQLFGGSCVKLLVPLKPPTSGNLSVWQAPTFGVLP